MTKPEKTYKRSTEMSEWIRVKLPKSSTTYSVTDIDFVLYRHSTKDLMLLEEKSRCADVEFPQNKTIEMLDNVIRRGIVGTGIKYHGFKVLRFEGTNFNNGRVALDNNLVTEEELIDILSMK